jgi:hypothetical protein
MHHYFRWPGVMVRNSASKVAPKLDVRGSGGYCLAPPSVHPTGRRYAWSVDSGNAIAAAPPWLIGLVADNCGMLQAPRSIGAISLLTASTRVPATIPRQDCWPPAATLRRSRRRV